MSDIDLEPAVSILIPVYKVEGYIERCARSIFEQTYKNLEYIFVDDGSPDRSMEVLERVMKDYPERAEHTRIICFPENKGLATARNTLVDNCQTDWLVHQDSDDWMDKDLVECLVKKQHETGADIVIADIVEHYDDSVFIRKHLDSEDRFVYLKQILSRPGEHFIWGRLIRRSLYVENGIRIAPECKRGEDFRAFVPLAFYSKKIVSVHDSRCHYDCIREDRNSHIYAGVLERKTYEAFDTHDVVRSFVATNMPEFLELFDTNCLLFYIRYYLSLSCQLKSKKIHSQMSKREEDMIKLYPYLRGGIVNRIKTRLKHNYFVYSSFMRVLYH